MTRDSVEEQLIVCGGTGGTTGLSELVMIPSVSSVKEEPSLSAKNVKLASTLIASRCIIASKKWIQVWPAFVQGNLFIFILLQVYSLPSLFTQ